MKLKDWQSKLLETRLAAVERELGLPLYGGIAKPISSKDFMGGKLDRLLGDIVTGFLADECDEPLCLEAHRRTYEDCLADSPESGYVDELLLPVIYPFHCHCTDSNGPKGHLATSPAWQRTMKTVAG